MELFLNRHVESPFSHPVKLLGIVRNVIVSFPCFDCLLMLYFTEVRADLCVSCYVEFTLPVLLPTSQKRPSGSLQLFLSRSYPHFHYNCAEVLKYVQ